MGGDLPLCSGFDRRQTATSTAAPLSSRRSAIVPAGQPLFEVASVVSQIEGDGWPAERSKTW